LHSPSTSIVDYAEVTRSLAADAASGGAKILLGHEVTGMRVHRGEVVISTRTAGGTGEAAVDQVIACGGLQSDRLAEMAGDRPDPV
ncbi:L-2-hydroxyglutarate oxidase, partial [Mycobacterium sp. ITM-2017-0098]